MRPQAPTLISFLAVALLTTGLLAEQPKPAVTRVAVILTTRTPLGDIMIELPAGTPLDSTQVTEGRIFINKPPFSGWISLSDTSLGAEVKPDASPIPQKEALSPKAESPMPLERTSAVSIIQGSLLGEPTTKWLTEGHLIPALCVIAFLACGSIIVSLVCLLLLKNRYIQTKIIPRTDAEKALEPPLSKEIKSLNNLPATEHGNINTLGDSAKDHDKLTDELTEILAQKARLSKSLDQITVKNRDLESLIANQKTEIASLSKQLRSAELKIQELTKQIPSPDVDCPLCGKSISQASLHLGLNNCPSCKQDFNCE